MFTHLVMCFPIKTMIVVIASTLETLIRYLILTCCETVGWEWGYDVPLIMMTMMMIDDGDGDDDDDD